MSAYRYEGPKVNDDMARAEAKALGAAVKSAGAGRLVENDEVVRILTTRSKPYLVETFKYYKEIYGKHIEEVINTCKSVPSAAKRKDSSSLWSMQHCI